jgi:hypothetical protein
MNKSIVCFAILSIFASGSFKLSLGDDQLPNKSCRQHPQLSGNVSTCAVDFRIITAHRAGEYGRWEAIVCSAFPRVASRLSGYANLPPELVDELAGLTTRCVPTFWSVHLPMTG